MSGKEDIHNQLVLLADDEFQLLLFYRKALEKSGFQQIATLDDSRQVMPFLAKQIPALIVLDYSMPFLNGKDLFIQIKEQYPQIPVIFITAVDDLETAVECMRLGAFDYLLKPFDSERMLTSIHKALEMHVLQKQVTSLKQYLLAAELKNAKTFAHIVTASPKMLGIFKYIEVIAESPFPILISGETGSGKELLAKAIYTAGGSQNNFVAVNAAGLDDTMFSDTLFGHKKGAFTGADGLREGLINQAAGGILFLDEIGDLSQASQVKLLRLIQENEYYPLGSDTVRKTDASIICASNHDLKALVQAGRFRKDLFFRLSVHQIEVPPLRERPEDIPLLVLHFLAATAAIMQKKAPTPPPELFPLLASYPFPGNVRELQTMVHDAMFRHSGRMLGLESFKKTIAERRSEMSIPPLPDARSADAAELFGGRMPTLKQAEDLLVQRALTMAKDNQGIAASLLGITRQALNKRLSRHKKIPKPTEKQP
jgi:two-component system, NtrC family, response regulator HydG